MTSNMLLFETSTESFIVKIWTEDNQNPAAWQGQITHVLSGEQRRFNSLEQIEHFILPYLQDIDIDFDANVFR